MTPAASPPPRRALSRPGAPTPIGARSRASNSPTPRRRMVGASILPESPLRPAATNCVAPVNARLSAPALRALFAALDEWTAKGVAPPASRAPLDVDLTPAQDLKWPKIPGLPRAARRRAPRSRKSTPTAMRSPACACPTLRCLSPPSQASMRKRTRKDRAAPRARRFPSPRRSRIAKRTPIRVPRSSSATDRAPISSRPCASIADKLVKERLLLQQDADAYVAAARSAPF